MFLLSQNQNLTPYKYGDGWEGREGRAIKRRVLQPAVLEFGMRVWFWDMAGISGQILRGEVGLRIRTEARHPNADTKPMSALEQVYLWHYCLSAALEDISIRAKVARPGRSISCWSRALTVKRAFHCLWTLTCGVFK